MRKEVSVYGLSFLLFKPSKNTNNKQSEAAPQDQGVNPSLLSLPNELLQHIADLLPLSSQACLAFSCHQIKAVIGTRSWQNLKSGKTSTNLEKLEFLRILRKDLTNSILWLCHNCIKFHHKTPLRFPTRGGTHWPDMTGDVALDYNETYYGFPFCDSPYTQAYHFIESALQRPLRKGPNGPRLDVDSAYYWHGHGGNGKISMEYKIFPRVAGTRFMLFTSHRFSVRRYADFNNDFFHSMNLDICPHFRLGSDYAKDDGSLTDQITRSRWLPTIICQTCYLEFDIKFESLAFGAGAMTVNVWQDLGWAKRGHSPRPIFSCFHRSRKDVAHLSNLSREALQPRGFRENWEAADVDLKPLPRYEYARGPFGGRYIEGGGGPLWSIPIRDLPALPDHFWNHRPSWKYIHEFRGEDQDDKNEFTQPTGFPHQTSLDALRNSATKCDLCDLILVSVNKFITELDTVWDDPMAKTLSTTTGRPRFELFLTKRREGGDGFWVFSNSEKSSNVYMVAAVGFCVREGDPLENTFIGRPIEEDSSSQTTLARAINWVKKCNEHPKCCSATTPLPARVIDVGNDDGKSIVKLCEPEGKVSTYITLSHCWGSATHITTTRASLAARKSGIDFNELPKSFQDAIVITRALGVRYIWIDSLCICQDDRKEWDRESAKMHSVYTNSYLTIAATCAKDSSIGCFVPRPPRRFVSLSHTSKQGLNGQVLAFLLPVKKEAMTDFYTDMKGEPLSKRAWGFQERMLPRRTLHYGKHQMYFECVEGLLGENGLRFNHRYHSIHVAGQGTQEIKPGNVLNQWHQLLWAYGPRKLTHESDKLPALSGIAQIFAERMDDQYVAGLWRKSLIEGLLWQGFKVHRVPEYRAPSWSWASVDGIPAAGLRSNWEPLATVIDCHVELKGINPYGEVKSGWIKLQAPLEPLFLVPLVDPDNTGIPYENNPKVWTENGDPDGVHSRFDFAFSGKAGKEEGLAMVQSLKGVSLFALLLATTKFEEDGNGSLAYHALIVSPTGDGDQSMRRLGFVNMDDNILGKCKALDPSAERPVITLV